jgi:hypothetical protein
VVRQKLGTETGSVNAGAHPDGPGAPKDPEKCGAGCLAEQKIMWVVVGFKVDDTGAERLPPGRSGEVSGAFFEQSVGGAP